MGWSFNKRSFKTYVFAFDIFREEEGGGRQGLKPLQHNLQTDQLMFRLLRQQSFYETSCAQHVIAVLAHLYAFYWRHINILLMPQNTMSKR